MVCRSTPGNSAATTIARATSGLHDVQVLSLFHEVRSEAPRSTEAPDSAEVAVALNNMNLAAARLDGVMASTRHRELHGRIDTARDAAAPDGRTYYAWRNITQRAIYARAAMDTHFQEIAYLFGSSTEQVEAAFNHAMRRDYRINNEEPQAPEHVNFSTLNLPHDRRTRHALAMLYVGGPQAINGGDPEHAASTYALTHANSERLAAEQATDPANQCPDCGQFANEAHVCDHYVDLTDSHLPVDAHPNPNDPEVQEALASLRARLTGDTAPALEGTPVAPAVRETPAPEPVTLPATAPVTEPVAASTPVAPEQATGERVTARASELASTGRGLRNPRRNYTAPDHSVVSIMNVSAVRDWFRDNPDGALTLDETQVLVADENGRLLSSGRVEGNFVVEATAARRSRNRDRFTVSDEGTGAERSLRCACAEYRTNYDCVHIRQATEHIQAILNRRDPVAVAPAVAMEAVTAEIREDYDASLAAAQEARASFEASATTGVSYGESMAAFQNAWDEAKASLAESHRLPYTVDNPTNGLGAREGGRSFGIEIEVDFPNDMTFEAKNNVAREIYEAGLSDSPEVRGWHHASRAGNRRAEHGSGYTDNPNRWTVEFDRSVDNVGGQRGCEIVSPILYDTPETWNNLKKVCDIVERHGGAVTPRTGLHINVGAADFNHTVGNHNRLIGLANAYEDVLVRTAHNPQSGPRHRGREYCRPMSMPTEGFTSIREAQRTLDPQNYEGSSHRAMINLDHVPAEGDRVRNSTRVEVRIFDGAIDPGRIQANVNLSLGLVNAAVRGAEVPQNEERAGTHRTTNAGANGRMRRLRGAEWESDTASFRRLADTIFTREEDKRQLTYAFAASRWQQR